MWMSVITGMENIYLMEIPTETFMEDILNRLLKSYYFLFN